MSQLSWDVLDLDYDAVAADIARRDHADANRTAAPLVVADGAITVDTTGLSIDEVVERVLELLPDSAQEMVPTTALANGGGHATGLADGPAEPSGPAQAPAPAVASPRRGPPAPAAEDRPLRPGELALYQFARLIFILFSRLFWRVTVTGRGNVPTQGAFVVAPVHRSNIDTILMAFVSKRHLRYMAKDSLWKHHWSARLLAALGGFPVNRETADREALRTCQAALARGEAVVIFPEGTRRSGPLVTDLFQGAAYMAVRAGVPIVPVGIGGSSGAMPKGSAMLRPVKVRIVIGEPIQPPSFDGPGGRGLRRNVKEMTGQLQADLQRLFDQAEGR